MIFAKLLRGDIHKTMCNDYTSGGEFFSKRDAFPALEILSCSSPPSIYKLQGGRKFYRSEAQLFAAL